MNKFDWGTYPLKLELLTFLRDSAGRPNYSRGLRVTSVEVEVRVYGEGISNPTLSEVEFESIRGHAFNHLLSTQLQLKGAVLCDNDDAFFRNMVPPHQFTTFMRMFTAETPLFFTPEVSPPPCRLNFPFLVGMNEANLIEDLRVWLERKLSDELSRIKVAIDFLAVQPFDLAEVSIRLQYVDSSGD